MANFSAIFIALLFLFPFLSLSFPPERSTDRYILVVVDDLALKSSHSKFFESLKARGLYLCFKRANDRTIALEMNGQYAYGKLILFSPTAKFFGRRSMDLSAVLDFVNTGHTLIVVADANASDLIRSIAAECGIDFDEDPSSMVIDHSTYDVSDSEGDHTLIASDDLIPSGVILGSKKIEDPVLFRGIGHSLNPGNSLVLKVLSASPAAYSGNPKSKLSHPQSLIGSAIRLVSVVQARNNARIMFSGSLDMFSNRLFNSGVQKAGSSNKYKKSGNEQFTSELSKWVFHERGHLKAVNVRHHKAGESEPSICKINDDLGTVLYIGEGAGDTYGYFQFKIEYHRLGYTSLSLAKQGYLRVVEDNAGVLVPEQHKGLYQIFKSEILPLLPAKALIRFKATCKDLCREITNPRLANDQRILFRSLSGFFNCQSSDQSIEFFPLDKQAFGIPDPSLYFFPEKVDILCSSNGHICCEGLHSGVYYMCNPITTVYVKLPKQGKCHGRGYIGRPTPIIAVENGNFRVICICPPQKEDDSLAFETYFSVTNSWDVSSPKCSPDVAFRFTQLGLFVNGKAYWQTYAGPLLAFNPFNHSVEILPVDPKFQGMGVLAEHEGGINIFNSFLTSPHLCRVEIYSVEEMKVLKNFTFKPEFVSMISSSSKILTARGDYELLPCVRTDDIMIIIGNRLFHLKHGKIEQVLEAKDISAGKRIPYISNFLRTVWSYFCKNHFSDKLLKQTSLLVTFKSLEFLYTSLQTPLKTNLCWLTLFDPFGPCGSTLDLLTFLWNPRRIPLYFRLVDWSTLDYFVLYVVLFDSLTSSTWLDFRGVTKIPTVYDNMMP